MGTLNFRIWVLSLFPEFFIPFRECGVVAKAMAGGKDFKIDLNIIQLRDFANNNYKSVDDYPFGGGPGMIMRADILKRALFEGVAKARGFDENIDLETFKRHFHVIFPSPRGEVWDHQKGRRLASRFWNLPDFSPPNENNNGEIDHSLGQGPANQPLTKDLIFICGRYEGIDERFIKLYVDEEISVGDYVLSGGELAVLVVLDSALRFVPQVLGNEKSSRDDSFEGNLLEHPQYTKPRSFEGLEVPEILLSGHHAKIEQFKKAERERVTRERRPDLYERYFKLNLEFNSRSQGKKNKSQKI